MSRSNFRQADIQRLIRAANHEGAVVQVDLRSLVVSITPLPNTTDSDLHQRFQLLPPYNFAPDGKEKWDED